MTNEYMTQEELLKWLAEAIHTETDKPENEIDWDFVEECENLMNALYGDTPYYTKEEAEKRIAQIIGKEPETKKTGSKLNKKTIIALILAATLACASLGVFAASPLKDMLLKAVDLNYGESFNDGTVTYVNGGRSLEYNSVEELLEKENLNIRFPKKLPEGVKVEAVHFKAEDNSLSIVFNDKSFNFRIEKYNSERSGFLDEMTHVEINGYKVYFIERNGFIWAYIRIDDDLYIIKAVSKEDLILIINNIGDV
ncbi:MAG: hypothetical protein IJE40_00045 [Clostridia bacterium]|nr:hypothetical protein [Clostridia bacterium]